MSLECRRFIKMTLKSKQQQTNLETIREFLTTMFCPNIPLLAKLKLALVFFKKYLTHLFMNKCVALVYTPVFPICQHKG
jgi:hypothetical protein